MADTQRVNLIDPDGNPTNVDASEAQQAISQGGYTVPSAAQIQDAQDYSNFGGGAVNSLEAGAAAAARAATFGFSDHVLTDSGIVDPHTLSELQRRHGAADAAGTGVGIIAPMLVGDEAGPLNLVSGVGKLGSAAEHATASILPAGESLASRILSKAGSKAVGSAVEGAAYGAGNVVSEAALGDPDTVAQHAVAQIGLSALLGGGLGATVGLGAAVVPEALKVAKAGLSNLGDKLSGLAGDGFVKASSAVSGVPEASIAEALENRGATLATPEARAQAATDAAESLAEQYKNTDAALKQANRDIRPVESSDLLKVDETNPKSVNPSIVNEEYQRVFNKVGDAVAEMRAKPDIYPGRFASKLEDIQSGLLRDGQSAQSPSEIFKTIDGLKQDLDAKVLKYNGVAAASDSDALNLVKSLRTDIKKSLENEGVFGPAASRQAAFNEAQNEYLTAKKEFEKNFLYKTKSNSGGTVYKANPSKVNSFFNSVGTPQNEIKKQALDRYMAASKSMVDQIQESYDAAPAGKFDAGAHQSLATKNAQMVSQAEDHAAHAKLLGTVNTGDAGMNPLVAGSVAHAFGLPGTAIGAGVGAYKALANPGGTISRLVALESIAQKSAAKISSGVKSVISGSSRAFSIGRGEVAAGLAKDFGKDSDESSPTYAKRTEDIQSLYGNIEKFQDKLVNATSDVGKHAPNIAASMQQTAVTGVSFLNSKIAAHPKGGPLDPEWAPPKSEISKFNRYYNAVQNPHSILKQAAAGTLTQEGVEAVSTVYPQFYAQIQSEIASQLVGKKSVSYRQKAMLSLLSGQAMTGSLKPAAIAATQNVYGQMAANAKQPSQGGGVHPSQSGLGKLNLGAGLQTRSQQVSQRK